MLKLPLFLLKLTHTPMTAHSRPVRVRIAPSPTGNLHVGTARAALFNYLFALSQKVKGQSASFVLRIEDTDKERSKSEFEQNIYDGLHSLGLQWDEGPDIGGEFGPYRQSERGELYTQYAEKLLAAGLAYYSDDTEDELTQQREAAKAASKPYVYRKHREATKDSPNATLRFAIPQPYQTVVINDAIRGDVSFDTELLGDFVILKSDGSPTYNFANVVDDLTMEISHVIRGEDHISNTPRQLLLYQAFKQLGVTELDPPTFAHASMILAPDRSKLSKRFGATAVNEYIAQGYLSEAFCNFLTLLGWAPPEEVSEVSSLDTFAQHFTLERIAKSPAIFETDKLNFINKQWLNQLTTEELEAKLQPYLNNFPWEATYNADQRYLLLEAVREPLTTLADITEGIDIFFGDTVEIPDELRSDVLGLEESQQVLGNFEKAWPTWDKHDVEELRAALKAFMKAQKPLKPKQVMWPIRVAVSGKTHGADLATTLYLLGEAQVSQRLKQALLATA